MAWTNNKPTQIVTEGGYTLEQILDNKHCSKDPIFWYPIEGSDKYLFKSEVAESWEFFDPMLKNPISNTNQIYLRFLDTSAFVAARDTFKLNGYYCPAPEDTITFNQFWDEQEELCDWGLEVGGVKFSGRYYFWLNYGRLKATENKRKIEREPSFIDHQYYWSLELEESGLEGVYSHEDTYLEYFPNRTKSDFRRLRKEGMVVSKSRRKGYSYYKASALHCYNFTWLSDSMNILAAFEKGHYKVPLDAIHMGLNFLNKNTPWVRRRDKLNTRTNFRASVETTNEYGVKIEEGYKSEVNCISFKDDPFKGIGDSVDYIDIEEAGKFTGLLETYAVSVEPLIRDGDIMIGIPLIGGTSGDMDKGSVDLYKIQSNPKSYGLKEYANIYDNRPHEYVGWFIDDMWMLFGFVEKELIRKQFKDDEYLLRLLDKYDGDIIETVDSQGNSHRRFAEIIIDLKREGKKKGDIRAYNKFISQQPKTLDECYLVVEDSPFDVATAKAALGELKTVKKSATEWGMFLLDSKGKVKWKNDFSMNPVTNFPVDTNKEDVSGCWVIFNKPTKNTSGEIPSFRYLAGNDPIEFGSGEVSASKNQHSLASCFIMDAITETIVAEYTGRPVVAEEYYEQLWRGIEYYNAEMLYENQLKGTFNYFRNKNKLSLLADTPQSLKDKYGVKSSGRVKGFHATSGVNQLGISLINSWTLKDQITSQNQETGEIESIPKMYTIKSVPLLQEIINWRAGGNFDRISALGACLILLEDRVIRTESIIANDKPITSDPFFNKLGSYNKSKFF